MSPDSASAAFPSRPSEEMSPREETQNLKFPIYFLPPSPPIQSNKILFYFYLCLLLQNWTMLFVNLRTGSKGPTPLQTYFVSKMYTISVKTRQLKIRKNAFEFQTKIQKHSAMVRGAVKKRIFYSQADRKC